MKFIPLGFGLGVVAALVSGCGAFAPKESIEESMTGMFRMIDKGDKAGLREYLVAKEGKFQASIMDMDMENKPVKVEGAVAVQGFLDGFLDEIAKGNVKFASTFKDLKSGVSGAGIGFAVYELTHVMTAGGKTETFAVWVTELLEYDAAAGRWRMFHLHASPAAVVAPPVSGTR